MLFVVFVSLGEAIWSPRWYDYSMSVAPEARLLPPQVLVLVLGVCAPTFCLPYCSNIVRPIGAAYAACVQCCWPCLHRCCT